MLFVVCTVFGVMLLVCQITLTCLGIGESQDFWDEEIDSDGKSSEETTCESDLVPISPIADQWEPGVAKLKVGIVSLRAIGTAITFFGLMGIAAEASRFSQFPAVAIASVAGLLAFIGVSVMFRLAAFQPYQTETKGQLDDSQEQVVEQSDQELSSEETCA